MLNENRDALCNEEGADKDAIVGINSQNFCSINHHNSFDCNSIQTNQPNRKPKLQSCSNWWVESKFYREKFCWSSRFSWPSSCSSFLDSLPLSPNQKQKPSHKFSSLQLLRLSPHPTFSAPARSTSPGTSTDYQPPTSLKLQLWLPTQLTLIHQLIITQPTFSKLTQFYWNKMLWHRNTQERK